MFSVIFDLLRGFFSLIGLFQSNKDQKIGKLEQQNEDDKNTLKVAQDAANIRQNVDNKTDDQLNTDLSRRLRG